MSRLLRALLPRLAVPGLLTLYAVSAAVTLESRVVLARMAERVQSHVGPTNGLALARLVDWERWRHNAMVAAGQRGLQDQERAVFEVLLQAFTEPEVAALWLQSPTALPVDTQMRCSVALMWAQCDFASEDGAPDSRLLVLRFARTGLLAWSLVEVLGP